MSFALEVHPTEIAFDIATTRRALDGGRREHAALRLQLRPVALRLPGRRLPRVPARASADRVFNVHVKDVWWSESAPTIGVFGGHADFGVDGRNWDFRSPGRGNVDFEEIVRRAEPRGLPGAAHGRVGGPDDGPRARGAAEAAFTRSFVRALELDFSES